MSEHDNVYLRRGKDVLHSVANLTTMRSQMHTANIPSAMGYNIKLQVHSPSLLFFLQTLIIIFNIKQQSIVWSQPPEAVHLFTLSLSAIAE